MTIRNTKYMYLMIAVIAIVLAVSVGYVRANFDEIAGDVQTTEVDSVPSETTDDEIVSQEEALVVPESASTITDASEVTESASLDTSASTSPDGTLDAIVSNTTTVTSEEPEEVVQSPAESVDAVVETGEDAYVMPAVPHIEMEDTSAPFIEICTGGAWKKNRYDSMGECLFENH